MNHPRDTVSREVLYLYLLFDVEDYLKVINFEDQVISIFIAFQSQP
jgi:hypothetical protein